MTKEGDYVDRRGGFEGGYRCASERCNQLHPLFSQVPFCHFIFSLRDERKSRIGAVVRIREASDKLMSLTQQETVLNEELECVETDVNEICRLLSHLEAEKDFLKKQIDETINTEITSRVGQKTNCQKTLSEKRSARSALRELLGRQRLQIETFEAEINSAFLGKLTVEEQAELSTLVLQERELSLKVDELSLEGLSIGQQYDQLAAELTLAREQQSETERILSDGAATYPLSQSSSGSDTYGFPIISAELDALQEQLRVQASVIHGVEAEVAALEQSIATRFSDVLSLEKEADETRNQEDNLRDELLEAAARLDKLLHKRSMLQEMSTNKQAQIRDLGALPRPELANFQGRTEKSLLRDLQEVNDKLKGFSAVNRKAMDQYVSFSEQRATLTARREELSRDSEAIDKLVGSLDAQKEEAILRTFRSVSGHFSRVFSELVPHGKGQLVMKSSLNGGGEDRDAADEDESFVLEEPSDDEGYEHGRECAVQEAEEYDDDERGRRKAHSKKQKKKASSKKLSAPLKSVKSASKVSACTGVQVRVSFSGTGTLIAMQQLSGGQKALVALALIFAIQRCDPAPFYLFDEIDQGESLL